MDEWVYYMLIQVGTLGKAEVCVERRKGLEQCILEIQIFMYTTYAKSKYKDLLHAYNH